MALVTYHPGSQNTCWAFGSVLPWSQSLDSLGQILLNIDGTGANTSVPTRLTQMRRFREEVWPGSLKKASDAKFTSDNFENDTEKIVGSSKAFQTISDLIANASEISIGGLPQPVQHVIYHVLLYHGPFTNTNQPRLVGFRVKTPTQMNSPQNSEQLFFF